LDKKPMTKDRDKCGIPISTTSDEIEVSGEMKKFKKERVVKDEDGNIIGVEKEWQ